MIDKPYNPLEDETSERATVGAMMASQDRVAPVISILGTDKSKFTGDAGIVYDAIVELDRHQMIADAASVKTLLRRKQSPVPQYTLLEYITEAYIDGCMVAVTPEAALGYAHAVQDSYTSRKLMQITKKTEEEILSHLDDPQMVLNQMEDELFRLRSNQPAAIRSATDMAYEYMQDLNIRIEDPGRLIGYATGIPSLDAILGGIEPSQFIVIAARPGMGKTQVATAIATHFVTQPDPIPVYFCSLEMSSKQMAGRMTAHIAQVNSETMKKTPEMLTSEERERIEKAYDLMAKKRLPLYFDFGGWNIMEIRAHAKQLSSRSIEEFGKPLGLVIVDYLQLVTGSDYLRKQRRDLEVGEVTRILKMLSMESELGCPVIGLSQITRQVETRTEKRPMLADLRESGNLEQDADIVMFHYPETAYMSEGQRTQELRKYEPGWEPAELIVAKNRDGATGTARVLWNKSHGSYRSIQ